VSQALRVIRLGGMNISKSYRVTELVYWMRRQAYALVLLSLILVAAYQAFGMHWVAMPLSVTMIIGGAASFIVGFKNAHTYGRTVEAQQMWATIASLSRYWGLLCRDMPRAQHEFSRLIRRHIAWLTALRYQMRGKRAWETADHRPNDEYQRKNFVVPENQTPLYAELGKHLLPEEIAQVEAARSKTGWLIGAQSEALRKLHHAQELDTLHHVEMQRTLKDLLDQQSRVERMKNYPYPRQYAVLDKILIWVFAAVLPLGLVREFDRLNELVTGPLEGHMAWFAVPVSALVSWLYVTLDKVGESTENPFEGGANDVPISQICRILEWDLLTLLGEPDRSPPDFDTPIVM